jgi:hypothetical protein
VKTWFQSLRFEMQLVPLHSGVQQTGLGRYALGKVEDVHWTEEHAKVTEYSQTRVLNRFGGYWDMSKPVLVEKSPPNAILSRYFQATYNIGNKGAWTNTPEDGFGGGTSVARFIFVSRHPIANALAQQVGPHSLPGAINPKP